MRAVRLTASVLALTLGGAGASAQTTYPPRAPSPYASVPTPYTVQPLSDADLLASEIRLLAANPQDLQALVRAGELALKLDDDTAAAAFFARAERIDPHNARVKAGEGSLLVSAERPGDALRHFAEAERLGGDPRSFAADRGLAYDLVGEQDRAQRDYRVALRGGPNDETQRRYALSLGISGKKDLALTQIDPLLRKSDRGAWRARAFILAMGGDKAGAEKIATSMMPAGMAQGLQPFFNILPSLRAADRAFAVHFGEVRPTPERMLDARMVPPLAALGPDPTAPTVAVAAVANKPTVVVDAREERRRARDARKNRGRIEVAAVTTPAPQPLPAPPTYVAQAAPPPYTGPVFTPRPAAPSADARAVMAANTAHLPPAVAAAPRSAAPAAFVQRVPSTPAPSARQPEAVASTQRAAPLSQSTAARDAAPTAAAPSWSAAQASVARANPGVTAGGAAQPVASSDIAPKPALAATPHPVIVTPTPPAAAAQTVLPTPAAATTLAAAAEAAPVVSAAPPPSVITATPPASVAAPAPVVAAAVAPQIPPTPVRSEDSILAAIISDIKVPGAELQPTTTAAPAPVETPAVDTAAIAERAAADRAAAAKRLADEKLAEKEAADKKAADKKLADKKAAADKKALADKKASADKKIADAKKLADAKAAEEKRKHDPKLLEPSRAWVQVAGGANENDLPKQWTKLRSANTKIFAGKSGWTTPLRATNRILTGPFADSDEAQAFVNKLTKEGLSGFVFVSEAGQKITKLAAK